jgi:hypothetical protein
LPRATLPIFVFNLTNSHRFFSSLLFYLYIIIFINKMAFNNNTSSIIANFI